MGSSEGVNMTILRDMGSMSSYLFKRESPDSLRSSALKRRRSQVGAPSPSSSLPSLSVSQVSPYRSDSASSSASSVSLFSASSLSSSCTRVHQSDSNNSNIDINSLTRKRNSSIDVDSSGRERKRLRAQHSHDDLAATMNALRVRSSSDLHGGEGEDEENEFVDQPLSGRKIVALSGDQKRAFPSSSTGVEGATNKIFGVVNSPPKKKTKLSRKSSGEANVDDHRPESMFEASGAEKIDRCRGVPEGKIGKEKGGDVTDGKREVDTFEEAREKKKENLKAKSKKKESGKGTGKGKEKGREKEREKEMAEDVTLRPSETFAVSCSSGCIVCCINIS